ncbi:MAG: hypothetical protein SFV51_24755 [Bryobacteraceae bacterium]|nr:hypothetical protein [Bryobacteraceae bacterium]
MKILLDECLPVGFRQSFPDYETHSAEWAGFKGMKNGKLLLAAELGGYDVLITVDRSMAHQNRLDDRRISIIVMSAVTNQLEELLPYAKSVLDALHILKPGQIAQVGQSDSAGE